MLTVKYEVYHNDNHRWVEEPIIFANYDAFGKWLLQHATPPTWHDFLSVPNRYIKKISARNYDLDEDIIIHEISIDDGLVFSDGYFTGGLTHISEQCSDFLDNLHDSYIHPDRADYNFVD